MIDKANELKQIGSRLSICRQNMNITQEELAGRLGITPQALSKWERSISLPDVSMLADISRLLGVSTDYLLGVDGADAAGNGRKMQLEIGANLRNVLEPLELRFGEDILPLFADNNRYVDLIEKVRQKLSALGILLPLVRITDSLVLEPGEFVIVAYQNVLYSEKLEILDEATMDYMIQKLEENVREKYHEIINPDIVRELVDNLKIKYPALIEGVVPEKIPYSVLAEVMRKAALVGGISAAYLPKMIEVMDCALWNAHDVQIDEIVERIVAVLSKRKE